jgi:EmrB/QacA subfamily drug resistance transporter
VTTHLGRGEAVDAQKVYQRRWAILGVLILSLFVESIDNTIVNVALPSLVRQLGATASQLQWITDAYILVFAGFLLTAGSLGDRFGRRKVLIIGLAIFGIASAASAFAGSATQLIVLRGLTGIGAALVMPTTLSILTNVFPDEERARAIAIWSAVAALSYPAGPIVGGWLLEHFWWGSIFLVNLPIVLVAISFVRAIVPESRDEAAGRPDPIGSVLSIVGLAALLYGIIESPSHGWTNPTVLGGFVLGVGLLGVFAVWELRSNHPMIDVRLFRNPRFSAASGSIALTMFALSAGLFFLTQHLQFELGLSPLAAGMRIAPVAIAIAVTAPLAPILMKVFGTRVTVAAGLAIVAVGLFVFSTATVGSGYALVVAFLAIVGVGVGIAGTPATDSIMGALPKAKAGVGSAVNDTTREIGGALGVAMLGTVLAMSYRTAIASAVEGLPAPAGSLARDSLGGALGVAKDLDPASGRSLAASAREAFVYGMAAGLRVGAVITLIGAAVALAFLPSRWEPVTEVEDVVLLEPRLEAVGGD